jgi:DNA-binding CsgD family transcriptional regulator
MPRLNARTRQRVRDIVESISLFTPGGPGALSSLTPELPNLLGAEKANCFALRPHGERLALASQETAGLRPDAPRLFDAWLARQPPLGWSMFNAVRPEPAQRNRVVDLAILERMTGRPPQAFPIFALLETLGVSKDQQLRTLVCDGASLLAYVGVYQPEPFAPHQKRVLAALVPSLARRLRLERVVAQAARQAAALQAALDAIGRPAFVVAANGTILDLNASGRVMLERSGADVRRSLADAIARRPGRYAFELTELRSAGEPRSFLAVLRADARQPARERLVMATASRLGLTPRKREVLDLVVRGMTNATIAAELGVSERAVEMHVTSIFDRAGVENRAALVALVLQAR